MNKRNEPASKDCIRWPGLTARVRGRWIWDLRYDAESGFVVIRLEGGGEIWVSADTEGCQVVFASHLPHQYPASCQRLLSALIDRDALLA